MTSTAAASPETVQATWKTRIRQAREAKRAVEPTFLSNLAFAAGQHWLVYDRRQNRMRHIADLDPRYQGRELYTADRITEYRDAQLGELSSDDERPELLAAQDGSQAESVVHELNEAVAYAWDHEWAADEAWRIARRYCVDLGVAAIRCRWNPNLGPTVGHAPVNQTGEPVTDPSEILALTNTGQMTDGSLPRFKPVKEGRTSWEPLSAFQLLTPPGVNHEKDFPWEIICRPVLIEDLVAEYGQKAAGLVEDGDIASAMGLTVGQQTSAGQVAGQGRLRDHVWLYTCYQRPSARFPDGQTVILASNRYTLLDQTDSLPYVTPSKQPHTGVVYLHWRRRSDRFWSGSFIENLKDPQRILNRRKTQNLEIIDRSMPRHFYKKGQLPEVPSGVPGEYVPVPEGADPPVSWAGFGTNSAITTDVAMLIDDIAHASTLSQVTLGENPPNADTYSALVLLNSNDSVKRSLVQIEHRAAKATLVELSVNDIVRYWPDQKKILVSGDDDQIRQKIFDKTRMPTFYMAKVAKGAVIPQSVGAELKKVDAVWAAAVECGLAVQQAAEWTAWYAASLDAGAPLPLPQPDQDSQQRMAQLENLLMQQGDQPQVMDYDLLPSHLPEHRQAQDDARAAGDVAWLARLDRHVADHVAQQQANAAMVEQARQIPGPATNTQPGGGATVQPQYAAQDFLRLAAGNP